MASVLGYWPWSSPIFLKLQVNFPITKTKYLAKYMKPGSLLHGLWVSFFLSDRIFQNLAPGTQVFLIFLEHRARVRERWVRVVQLQSQILSLFKMIFFFLAYHGFFFFFCIDIDFKIFTIWSSRHGAPETKPTSNHEVVCSIPGLTQWVKDLNCHELWCRSQTWLRSHIAAV